MFMGLFLWFDIEEKKKGKSTRSFTSVCDFFSFLKNAKADKAKCYDNNGAK